MLARIYAAVLLLSLTAAGRLYGQGLSPRAYVVAPVHSNAVTITYSLQDGNIVFVPTLPIQNASGRIGTWNLSYFRTLSFFGRSANASIFLPYGIGHFEGEVLGEDEKVYRSGLAPLSGRFSVNLHGAPAMTPREFAKWKQKLLIGASIVVETPTGQYDPARFINISDNRWSFKPEIGLSRRWSSWLLDGYVGAWFFTPNNNFFSKAPGSTGPNRQTEAPMGATELHLSYDVKPRMWFSIDGNYWYGGVTSVNGKPTPTTLQANSRLGGTAAIPVSKHQSLKCSYSRGAFIRFGGNFQQLSLAWQYSWTKGVK